MGKWDTGQLIAKWDKLKGERGIWETHWQEVTNYTVPRKNHYIRTVVPGEKKGIELYDNTAMIAAETLVAALHGMLTNPSTYWFLLQTGNLDLDKDENIVEYLEGFTHKLHRIINNANFQPEVYEFYLDLVSVGTAIMYVEYDEEHIVRFSTRHLGDVVIEENHQGVIETCVRMFKYTAHQLVQEFAPDANGDIEKIREALGDKVARAYEKNEKTKFEVLHGVYRDMDDEKEQMPFVSQYCLKSDKRELKTGRYRRFPYIISRWSKVAGEVYGRSPAMTALPEAKTLNVMAKTMLKGAQKVVDPPVQLPDEGYVRPFRTAPASVNYYRAGSQDKAEPIFNDSRIDFGFEAMRERQLRIREAFFIDKLNLAQNDRMTQLEVSQRVQEQMRFMGPLVGRQQPEFLRPLINRIIDIINTNDTEGVIIGDIPPELEGIELDVAYSSPVARAQRVGEAQSLTQAFQASVPIFQIDQNAQDLIDGDEWVKEQFKVFGATTRVLRGSREVEEIRQARAQAQAQALEQQQAMQGAEIANKTAPLVNKE